jgi:putative flavoprotein involved in K+ transport
MTEHTQVAIVGGGQAGLSMSYLLGEQGIDHVVLERETACHDWVDRRWDSFCLVTPNFQCRLPGKSYDAGDDEGFMLRDEVHDWLRDYLASFSPPVREQTAVRRLDAGFRLETSGGDLVADQVVIATGGYHIPRTPALAEALPAGLAQLHSATYRRPEDLPAGDVLVVGTGQSGVQIAEDLHVAGRRVHLAVGSAPRAARRYRGRDTITWLEQMGHYDRSALELGNERGHDRANHYMTGRGGGHDVDLRAFAQQGMTLHGRLLGLDGDRLRFGEDLQRNLDHADEVAESIKDSIDAHIAGRGLDVPIEARYAPSWEPAAGPSELALDALGAVVWATGFRRDDGWNRLPAFDGGGFPVHLRGVSPVPGLYWLGLPWQHTWGSGRFAGVARDAQHLLEHIVARVGARTMVSVG